MNDNARDRLKTPSSHVRKRVRRLGGGFGFRAGRLDSDARVAYDTVTMLMRSTQLVQEFLLDRGTIVCLARQQASRLRPSLRH